MEYGDVYENTVSGNFLESFENNESTDNDSTETDIDVLETDSDSSGENQNKDITERLDELISILTPVDEENEENESSEKTVSGNSLESSSDSQSSGSFDYESLDGINEALSLIRSENSDYYKETLLIQKNMQIEMQHISYLAECMLAVSMVIGFFVAMHVGGKLVSYFWERIR